MRSGKAGANWNFQAWPRPLRIKIYSAEYPASSVTTDLSATPYGPARLSRVAS
jgi:hypothetical protein